MPARHGLVRVPRLLRASRGEPAPSLYKGDPNVIHVIMFYGQSNVTGVNGMPIQTQTPREDGCYSWNVGPRIIQPDEQDNDVDVLDLDLLTHPVRLYEREQQAGGGAWVETAASAMLGRLRRMGVTNTMFALNMGRGGRQIDQLKKGTIYWEFGRDALRKLVDVYRDQQGKRVLVTACVWSQGTGDRTMPEAEYRAKFDQLVDDYQADFKGITGQLLPIKFIVLQDGSDFGGFFPIPQDETGEVNAQFKAAVDRPSLIRMPIGQYHKIHHPDQLHMLGAAQLMSGEEYALAYHSWVWDQSNAEVCLRPTHFELTPGNTGVYVYLTGQVGDLVLDTAWVNNPGAHGWQLYPSGADPLTEISISSVTVDNANGRIELQTAVDLSAQPDLHIGYAWNNGLKPGKPGPAQGPRGTVRDNAAIARIYEGRAQLSGGPNFTVPDPNLLVMHRWLLRFKLPLAWSAPAQT